MKKQRQTKAIATKALMPTSTKPGRVQPFVEVGRSGLKYAAGEVDEEFLRDLRGSNARRMWREMRENSPVCGAVLFAVEQLLRRVAVDVKPASEMNEDQRAADLVRTALEDMTETWDDTLTEILTFLPFGFSFLETVYKRRTGESRKEGEGSKFTDGMIGWKSWSLRGQDSLDSWEFDETGKALAFNQQVVMPAYRATIPLEKGLLFRTKAEKGNPEGRSIFRSAYIPYYYIKRIQALEGIGIERDLAGMPVIFAPPEIMTAEAGTTEAAIYAELKNIITAVKRDEQEGVVMPLDYDDNGNPRYKFELLSAAGSRQFDTHSVIQRHEQRVAMCTMADFILLGHEKVGSFALADSKTNLFGVALEGWMDSVLSVVNTYAIPRLLRLNGIRVAQQPMLTRGEIVPPNLQELGEFVGKLSGAGMMMFPSPDGELEKRLLDVANLPSGSFGEGEVGKANVDVMGLLMDTAAALREVKAELAAIKSQPHVTLSA